MYINNLELTLERFAELDARGSGAFSITRDPSASWYIIAVGKHRYSTATLCNESLLNAYLHIMTEIKCDERTNTK